LEQEQIITAKVLHQNDSPDSIEIGTPAKGGAVKIYGDFNNKEAFEKKIDIAKEIREYAQAKIFPQL